MKLYIGNNILFLMIFPFYFYTHTRATHTWFDISSNFRLWCRAKTGRAGSHLPSIFSKLWSKWNNCVETQPLNEGTESRWWRWRRLVETDDRPRNGGCGIALCVCALSIRVFPLTTAATPLPLHHCEKRAAFLLMQLAIPSQWSIITALRFPGQMCACLCEFSKLAMLLSGFDNLGVSGSSLYLDLRCQIWPLTLDSAGTQEQSVPKILEKLQWLTVASVND